MATDERPMQADGVSTAARRVGVFTTDRELNVQSWDSWLEQHTLIPAATAVGARLEALVPDLAARRLLQRFQRVAAQGVVEVLAPAFHHYLLRCAPAEPSPYFDVMQQRVTIAPLRLEAQIVGTIVTIEDVTARLDRERELATQLESNNSADRLHAVQTLASTTEHEPALLVGALSDEEWRVRRVAASGLGERAGPEVIAEVLRIMRQHHQDLALLNSALQVLALTNIDVVGPLVEFLEHSDADLRTYAALALADQPDPRASAALIQALADPDPNVRFHVMDALGKLRAPAAAEPLVAIAETRDFFLAFPAIDALAKIGDHQVAPRLVPLLADDVLQAPVAEALGTLGDETVVAPLVLLLNSTPALASVIARALMTLYARYETAYGEGSYIADLACRTLTPPATQQLLAALENARGDELRPLVVVIGWLEGAVVQAALARLLAQPEVRSDVIAALVRFGRGVTELLVAQLDAEDVSTRMAAVVALGRIGDAAAVPALIGVLLSDPEVQVAAADALAKIGDHRAFDALLQQLGHPDVAVRQAAIAALNSLGHPELEARVGALLQAADSRIRESAVRIAGYFGYASSVDAVLRCCDDPVERVRQAAVEALPYLDDPRCPPRLLRSLQSDAPNVRAAAARALGVVDGPDVIHQLVGALDDAHPWVRYFAAWSLGQQCGVEAVDGLIRVLQTDEAGQVRIAAAEALGKIGGAQAVAALLRLTTATDSDLAGTAIRALGQTRDPAALPALLGSLRATDPAQRSAAIAALAKHGAPGVVEPLQWVAAADADGDLRAAAIDALGRTHLPGAIAALIELLLNPEQRPVVVEVLADRGRPFVAELGRGLAHPHTGVRVAVVEALARMKLPEATAMIVTALDDADPMVRMAGARALRHGGRQQAEHKLTKLAVVDPDARVRRAVRALLEP